MNCLLKVIKRIIQKKKKKHTYTKTQIQTLVVQLHDGMYMPH